MLKTSQPWLSENKWQSHELIANMEFQMKQTSLKFQAKLIAFNSVKKLDLNNFWSSSSNSKKFSAQVEFR